MYGLNNGITCRVIQKAISLTFPLLSISSPLTGCHRTTNSPLLQVFPQATSPISWATRTTNNALQHDKNLVLRLGGSDLLEVNRGMSGGSELLPISQNTFISKNHPHGLLIYSNR